MEAGLRLFLLMRGPLAALALALSANVAAQGTPAQTPVIQPEVSRTPVDLAAIDSENFEVSVLLGLLAIEDFGVAGLRGLRLTYHVTPGFFAEFSHARATADLTSFERLSEPVRLLTEQERELEYSIVSLGYNLLPGESFWGEERAFNSALYLVLGTGTTEFAGSDRYTLSYGFGYRLLVNDWLAVHLGARNHLFDMDLLGPERTTNNLELNGALSVFF